MWGKVKRQVICELFFFILVGQIGKGEREKLEQGRRQQMSTWKASAQVKHQKARLCTPLEMPKSRHGR